MLRHAIGIAMLLLSCWAPPAHAYVRDGEPQPQSRSTYVRGLAGFAYYYSFFGGIPEHGWGANFGGEIGFDVLELSPNTEFSRIMLGLHFDYLNVTLVAFDTIQTHILAQILFVRADETMGAYFGPEIGLRTLLDSEGGSLGSGLLAGAVAGIELPLTTHLSYGPQFEALYGFPAPTGIVIGGIEEEADGFIGKFHLAVTYHF